MRRYIHFVPALLVLLALAPLAHAAGFSGSIFPSSCLCLGKTPSAPDFGCVLQVFQNVIRFGVYLVVILATVYTAYVGFQFMISGGNEEARTKAKNMALSLVVGISLVLGAWLIVDFIMKTLYQPSTAISGKNFGPWNAILAGNGNDACITVNKDPISLTDGSVTALLVAVTHTGGTSNGGVSAGDESSVRSQLSNAGISVNHSACTNGQTSGCTDVAGFKVDTVQQIINVNKVCGGVQVTGGTEGGHAGGDMSHGSGYKVDLATNIDSCIQGNKYFTQNGARGGASGGAQYTDACGNVYVRETSPAHWDITVKQACNP